ncbi:MAG TPA: hypothetical protein VKP30_26425 [Polyangiaceae bacterium]|nr:hypothetical protein [Polyangiaceae bacterium]
MNIAHYAVVLLVLAGCGRKTATDRPPSLGDALEGANAVADDASRCEYRGRPDREAKESAGLGTIRPNIRRVYALVGEGDDRRRVLLCREVDSNLDGTKDVVRTFNEKGESLRELADSDFDGKIDTWVTFARGRMAKVEIDSNRDGIPDEFRYYVQGKLARMQRDTNRDGKADVWEIFEDGSLKRMGFDVDYDGHVDRWDRDEVAERAALERELAEEEKRKRDQAAAAAEAEKAAAEAAPEDSVSKGHVSPRKR